MYIISISPQVSFDAYTVDMNSFSYIHQPLQLPHGHSVCLPPGHNGQDLQTHHPHLPLHPWGLPRESGVAILPPTSGRPGSFQPQNNDSEIHQLSQPAHVHVRAGRVHPRPPDGGAWPVRCGRPVLPASGHSLRLHVRSGGDPAVDGKLPQTVWTCSQTVWQAVWRQYILWVGVQGVRHQERHEQDMCTRGDQLQAVPGN